MKSTKSICLALLAVLLSPMAAHAGPIRVAVEASASSVNQQGATKIQNSLNDDTYFDFQATIVSGADIDTQAELDQFDVVLIGDGGSSGDDDYNVFASALRAWVEAGSGGVVGTGWLVYEAGISTGAANADIDAIIPVDTSGTYGFFNNGVVSIVGGHAITLGVNDFTVSGCCIEYAAGGVDSGAQVLGTTSGQGVIVVDGSLRSVYLGPAYSAANAYSSSMYNTDGDRLLEQAVAWAADGGSVSVPEPGTLALLGLGLAGMGMSRRKKKA